MKYTCPVCAYDGLEEPPAYFTICPSCGTEFGYQDTLRGHDELRADWIAQGPIWQSSVIATPPQWNGMEQLRRGGLIDYSPVGAGTQTEIAVVEIGRHSAILDLPTGSVRINAKEYGVGRIVNLLAQLRFAGTSSVEARV
jgi:hypothetical protein